MKWLSSFKERIKRLEFKKRVEEIVWQVLREASLWQKFSDIEKEIEKIKKEIEDNRDLLQNYIEQKSENEVHYAVHKLLHAMRDEEFRNIMLQYYDNYYSTDDAYWIDAKAHWQDALKRLNAKKKVDKLYSLISELKEKYHLK